MPGARDRPQRLPLFPLTGALLLPRARLPLNVFEPRYRAMTEAALGEGRLIGMIQPLEGRGDADDPPLYRTGCAGRIVEFRETGDGRYVIALEGVSRFDVMDELPRTELFRRALPDWTRYEDDRAEGRIEGFDRKRLLAALDPYLRRLGAAADLSSAAELSAERLVNAVAMLAPFAPAEKQALLEAGPLERATLLTKLIEMALLAGTTEDAPARQLSGGQDMAELDPKLLEILVCPLTKGPLSYDRGRQELLSLAAGLAYPIRDGIPIMLADEARPLRDDEKARLKAKG